MTGPNDGPDQMTGPGTAPPDVAPNFAPGSGIAAQGVFVTYRNGQTALSDTSFEVPTGTITALVGVNGAGKSTIFKAIMGFVPLARGRISVLGRSAAEALRANLVAYVPQAEEVDWSFPVLVEDVVMMGRYGHMGFFRRPGPADHAAVTRALGRVNMTEYRKRQIGDPALDREDLPAAQAGVSGPRAGARGAGDPAGRAFHRRRCADRRGDHRPVARAAHRGAGHAGLDP